MSRHTVRVTVNGEPRETEVEARLLVEEAGRATGLPSTDPVRFGAEVLAEAVEVARRAGAGQHPAGPR